MYTVVVMIEKHLQDQLQRFSAKQNRKNKSRIPCTLALAGSRKYVSFRLILIQFYVA